MRITEEQRIEFERLLGHRETIQSLAGSSKLIPFQAPALTGARQIVQRSVSEAEIPDVQSLVNGVTPPDRETVEQTLATFHTIAAAAAHITQDTMESRGSVTRVALSHLLPTIGAFAFSFPTELLDGTAQAIAQAKRIDFSGLGAISGSGGLAALDFSRFRQDIAQIRTIHGSYSGQLAKVLRNLLGEQEITEENMRPVIELVNVQVSNLPASRVVAEGMITLIATVLTVLFSYELKDKSVSSVRQLRQLHQLEQVGRLVHHIVNNTERLLPVEDNSTYYFVDRQVFIGAKPNKRTFQIGQLFPEQKVRLVNRNHKWIRVEYFDQIDGSAKYGWAPKKYFLPIATTSSAFSFSQMAERIAITENWEQTNKRRVELIQKSIDDDISPDELIELGKLQHLADERIRLVAPLPIASLELIGAGLRQETEKSIRRP